MVARDAPVQGHQRARQRENGRGRPSAQRKAPGRLVEGQVVTNWKQALEQLALAYPDRIDPTSHDRPYTETLTGSAGNRPFFGQLPTNVQLDNPTVGIQGTRVTHLVYPVQR
jgi:hypothetical protein